MRTESENGLGVVRRVGAKKMQFSRRRWWILVGAVVVVLGVAGLATALAVREGEPAGEAESQVVCESRGSDAPDEAPGEGPAANSDVEGYARSLGISTEEALKRLRWQHGAGAIGERIAAAAPGRPST